MTGLYLNYNLKNISIRFKIYLYAGFFLASVPAAAQLEKTQWVDSVFATLSLEDKIAQLFFISTSASDDPDKLERDLQWVKSHSPGGVLISGGGPNGTRLWLNHLQQHSRIPLLAGIHAEEGLGIVLDSTLVFPPMLALGAVHDDSLLFFMGQEIARQARQLGLHFNLAPSLNRSSSFQTPDLYYHSFGNDPAQIAARASLYAAGLHSGGLLPIAKYVPESRLEVSHYLNNRPVFKTMQQDTVLPALFRAVSPSLSGVYTSIQHNPIFPKGKRTIKPFMRKKTSGLPLLYSATWIKQYSSSRNLILTFMPELVTSLEKDEPGKAEWYAFLVGFDILIDPDKLPTAIRRLHHYFSRSPAQKVLLDDRIKKILSLKYDAGLAQYRPAGDLPHKGLTTPQSVILKRTLYEESIALLTNRNEVLPLRHPDLLHPAIVCFGENMQTPFTERMRDYGRATIYPVRYATDTTGLVDQLSKHNVVIIAVYPYASNIQHLLPGLLQRISNTVLTVVCNFTSPENLPDPSSAHAILQAWVDVPEAQQGAAGIIFGALPARGKLPITAGAYSEGIGLTTTAIDILRFAEPEEAEMSREVLEKIGNVAREAITGKATPGCQVLVARKGKIVYHRAFGWLTYDNQKAVNTRTLYDLASITKVAATLQAIMFLYEKGEIDLNKKVSVYLPDMIHSNKKDIILKDVLTHQAGLVPFEPWYPLTMRDTALLDHYYSRVPSPSYPLRVAPRLYAASHIRDSLWKWTLNSRMLEKPPRTPYPFRYSDLSFIILHRLAEKMLNQPLDEFLRQNLYEPLGAFSLGFNPLDWADADNIAPTEYDKTFRKQLIAGTVHDERAAMMGGVAGHAGLFGNALDLAKLGQMLLQQGSYGGVRYLQPQTIRLFSTRQYENSRRGLGWDKPMLSDFTSPTSLYASPKTYGHTGFTGTCIWIDPEFDLIYIFLSNRVYPDRSNKLITDNIRSRIQDLIYQAIFEYCAAPNPLPWNISK